MIAPEAHPSAASGSVGPPVRPTDPRNRNEVLLAEWEADNLMTICTPHGNVYVSDKLLTPGYADGRALVSALVAAAASEWENQ